MNDNDFIHECLNCPYPDCIDECVHNRRQLQQRDKERQKEYYSRRYNEAKEKGLCAQCYKRKAIHGVYCATCWMKHRKVVCKQCGEPFTRRSVTQKYCSTKCAKAYYRTHDMKAERISIIFTCAHCGREVETETDRSDMRTRFCSAQCEKKYWRHPPHEHKSSYIVKTRRDLAAEKGTE